MGVKIGRDARQTRQDISPPIGVDRLQNREEHRSAARVLVDYERGHPNGRIACAGRTSVGRLKLTQETFQLLPIELVSGMTEVAVHDRLAFCQ
jgi:hypothetical protein